MPKTLSNAEQLQEYHAMQDQFHMLMRHLDFINLRLRAATAILITNEDFKEVDWSPGAVDLTQPPN